MAPGISYDDSGSLASYFAVTFLALLLVPATFYTLKPPASKESIKTHCPCSSCKKHDADIQSEKNRIKRRRLTQRILPLIAGWAFFTFLAYGLYTSPSLPGQTVYNPFEILGISSSSTEKQIKKHYKKLSLQFHPDKIKLAENQTKEDADAKFVDLTKAYKALTDEVTRENLAKYGNPDGPQQREDKIAIPQWVVEGKNNVWVLGAYGIVLGLGIPFVVGRWWFRQRRLTRDGILNGTAEIFFHQLREDTDFVSLISLLASSLELHAVLSVKRRHSKKERKERSARIEELEKQLDARRAELGVHESPTIRKESKVQVTNVVAKRARALLWAHLLRFDIEDELKKEQQSVLKAVQPVLAGLANIALAHNWLTTSHLCISLQPCLAQAVPLHISPLAQLPDVSFDQAREMEVSKAAEGKRWLEKWVKADVDGFEEAKLASQTWPRLEIVSAEFKVTGERVVSPSSIVNLTYKCRYVYPTSTPIKTRVPIPAGLQVEKADSVAEVEDNLANGRNDTKEGPVTEEVIDEKAALKDALSSDTTIKESETDKTKKGQSISSQSIEIIKNGPFHAPFWPFRRKPFFYVLLGDSKLDKVIVQPQRITDIPMPNADGTPAEPREFTLQFQAPPQPNLYSFVVYWRSDTLLGADVQVPIMLKVEEAPDDDNDDADDISEPDEDSLAGQMAMMRGEKVRRSGVHGDDDDDDGDDDEYEYETESSDEEGPKRKRAINEDTDSDSD